MREAYDGRQVVGMDLHRRRSVPVRRTEDSQKLETIRISPQPLPSLGRRRRRAKVSGCVIHPLTGPL